MVREKFGTPGVLQPCLLYGMYCLGLTVEQWTDEKVLHHAISQLDKALQDFHLQMKTSYVPLEKKIEVKPYFLLVS